MTDGLNVEGPLIDEETGMRLYRVNAGGRETEFGIVPVDSAGETGWILRAGSAVAQPEDLGYEPYASAEEAYDAGLRASKAALGL